jgi:hypothetical protein
MGREYGQATTDTRALTTALNCVSQQRVTIDNSLTQRTAALGSDHHGEDSVDRGADGPDAGWPGDSGQTAISIEGAEDGTRIGDCAAWIGKSFRQVAGSDCSQLLASSLLLPAGFPLSSTMER